MFNEEGNEFSETAKIICQTRYRSLDEINKRIQLVLVQRLKVATTKVYYMRRDPPHFRLRETYCSSRNKANVTMKTSLPMGMNTQSCSDTYDTDDSSNERIKYLIRPHAYKESYIQLNRLILQSTGFNFEDLTKDHNLTCQTQGVPSYTDRLLYVTDIITIIPFILFIPFIIFPSIIFFLSDISLVPDCCLLGSVYA